MKFLHDGCVCNCTEGFKEAADKFRAESGVEPCSDLSSLDNRIKVREAVLSGSIQSAIALVNDLYPELLDNDRLLCFHLQVDCGCCYSNTFQHEIALIVAGMDSLKDRLEMLMARFFKKQVLASNASLHYLLPEPRDNDTIRSLRNSQPFPSMIDWSNCTHSLIRRVLS